MWWPGTELNRRRQPFQGCALPTELPGRSLQKKGSPSAKMFSHCIIAVSRTPMKEKFLRQIPDGGEGGIRTHGTRKGSTVFETARFNRSRTSPALPR